jgi:hypothetical protein
VREDPRGVLAGIRARVRRRTPEAEHVSDGIGALAAASASGSGPGWRACLVAQGLVDGRDDDLG